MIRFLLVATTVVTFLVLSIPALIVEWIIGKFNPDLKSRSSLTIVQGVFRICLWISGVKVTTIGLDRVPSDQAVLYVGNHRSAWDILLTYVRVARPTGYISKLEMDKWPLLNLWMRNLHCLFLDRKDLRQGLKIILTSIERIKSGISICVFPEGTRCKEPDGFLPFHDGSFKIAEKSKCPIVPITINNASAMFEDQYPRIKPTHVIIEYGTPILMSTLDPEDRKHIGNYVQNVIKTTYFKNKDLV